MKSRLKIITIGFVSLMLTASAFSQAKKPELMVVPSDNWCVKNGYSQTFDNQGSFEDVPNYKKAFQGNSDLLLVISKINGLMLERGFKLRNLEDVMKSITSESAEDALTTNKSGAGISESPLEKLTKVAKADIWLKLTWSINKKGSQQCVTFILQGIDAYTQSQVASAEGTGAWSFSAELPRLLEEAVLSHLDNFNAQLQAHFDDMFINGREVMLVIKKNDSFKGDLESTFGGQELNKIIEDWVSDNTVQHRFSLTDATENKITFEQVRIPLYDSNNRSIDARAWTRGLYNLLKDKYQIESKLMTKGLGRATIIIGEK
jgi:hypothetical protein